MLAIVKRFIAFRLLSMLCCTAIILLSPQATHAANPQGDNRSGPVLITELQAGTTSNASEEFIELYNASGKPIDLAAQHWRLQFADSAATSWGKPHRDIPLVGTLPASSYVVIASQYTASTRLVTYLPDIAGSWFSAGIAANGGHVRLAYSAARLVGGICASTLVVADELEWSQPVGGAPARQSLDGRTGYLTNAGGLPAGKTLQRVWHGKAYGDSDNDLADFVLGTSTPGVRNKSVTNDTLSYTVTPVMSDACTPTPPSPGSHPPDPGSGTPVLPPGDQGLVAPQLSELLPNPAAPAADANDEFIELYNPNNVIFDLSGFSLETGTAVKHAYMFPPGTILPASGFVAFFSRVTKLALANNGGRATLLDPFGSVLATSDPYGIAAAGQSWILANGSWQWSSAATPNAANEITPVSATSSKSMVANAPTKKIAAKAVISPRAAVKAAKITKAAAKTRTTKTPTSLANTQVTPQTGTGSTPSVLHPGVLAVVAVIAVVYGGYEYRHDLANKFYQLRTNRGTGRKNRPGAAGR